MSSVLDAFYEAIMEKAAMLKIFVYALPVFFAATAYIGKQMPAFNFWKIVTAAIFLGALTFGIYCVKHKKETVLTLNPFELVTSLLKALVVIVPHTFVWYAVGSTAIKFIPTIEGIPHFDMIMQAIVWGIVGAIVLSAYMCFAANMQVPQGFNIRKVFNSCVDIFVCVFFFLPQLLIADAILIFPIMYSFTYLDVPLTHWGFIWYCSMISVINLSVFANYLAQTAYEHIQLDDEDYKDKYIIDEVQVEKGKDNLKKFF